MMSVACLADSLQRGLQLSRENPPHRQVQCSLLIKPASQCSHPHPPRTRVPRAATASSSDSRLKCLPESPTKAHALLRATSGTTFSITAAMAATPAIIEVALGMHTRGLSLKPRGPTVSWSFMAWTLGPLTTARAGGPGSLHWVACSLQSMPESMYLLGSVQKSVCAPSSWQMMAIRSSSNAHSIPRLPVHGYNKIPPPVLTARAGSCARQGQGDPRLSCSQLQDLPPEAGRQQQQQ
ncbi:hypothetical protein V8C86DRAFT_832646 [Haematococcus lacustris]